MLSLYMYNTYYLSKGSVCPIISSNSLAISTNRRLSYDTAISSFTIHDSTASTHLRGNLQVDTFEPLYFVGSRLLAFVRHSVTKRLNWPRRYPQLPAVCSLEKP